MPQVPSPSTAYAFLKDQLGSIRSAYLAGNQVTRHVDFGSGREIVLLVQGFFQTRQMWSTMERRLRDDDYSVVSFHLGGLLGTWNTHGVARSAHLIAEKVERLVRRHGVSRLHIVGHSKGGLIARYYIQHLDGHRRTKSLITLGSPHGGAPLAAVTLPFSGWGLLPSSTLDLLPRSTVIQSLERTAFPDDIPFTAIYSTGDYLCRPASAQRIPRQRLVTSIEVPDLGHSELAWDPDVYALIRHRLVAATELWQHRARIRSAAPR